MQIPNTTNLLEGFNSQLKRALHNHNGLNEANKKKFIDGFINTKKRVCQNVHILFLCTKPRLSQARALLFPKVFVPLGIKKISL